jgi:hypothetical protein
VDTMAKMCIRARRTDSLIKQMMKKRPQKNSVCGQVNM